MYIYVKIIISSLLMSNWKVQTFTWLRTGSFPPDLNSAAIPPTTSSRARYVAGIFCSSSLVLLPGSRKLNAVSYSRCASSLIFSLVLQLTSTESKTRGSPHFSGSVMFINFSRIRCYTKIIHSCKNKIKMLI